MAAEGRPDHDHDTTEHTERVERFERVVERPSTPAPEATNVNATTTGFPAVSRPAVWTVTRVITLIFTVLEVVLLLRFILKLTGANANQPLVMGLYGITEPLVRPFQGIFPEQAGPPIVDLPALLAIVFLFLVTALVVALVRAITGERRSPDVAADGRLTPR